MQGSVKELSASNAETIAFGSESGHSSTNVQSLSIYEQQIAKVGFGVALPKVIDYYPVTTYK